MIIHTESAFQNGHDTEAAIPSGARGKAIEAELQEACGPSKLEPEFSSRS